MKIKKSSLLLIASIVFYCAAIIYSTKRSNAFYCISHIDSFYPSSSIHTSLQLFIDNDNIGSIAYRGAMLSGQKKYHIDRDITFSVYEDNKDGIMTVELLDMVKKPGDNVPDEAMWNKQFSSGLRYYPLILKTKNDDIIITEKGAPLYVCSKKVK